MRRRSSSLAVAAVLALTAPPALAASTAALPPPDTGFHLSPGTSDYRIGPQDKLSVDVSQLPDLTKEVQVDPSGRILLPLIGQVQAAGRTPAQLSDDIATALKQKYMKDPIVVVSVKEANGEKVTIDGAVEKPGVYPLTGPTSLMEAVAMAQGPDPKLANTHRVAIFRTIGGQRRSAIYDLAEIRQGKAQDPAVYGSDIVVVDSSGAKSFIQNFSGGSFIGLLGMLIRPW
jgi:polysaccharide export outer membrane protein